MFTYPLGSNPFIFYTGSSASEVAIPFTVRLDNRTFAVDLRNYRRSSVSTLRDAIVSTGQVDDSLFNTDGAWWRYRRDWQGGAGQDVMDLGESKSPVRFSRSVGIDPWTEGELGLLPATSAVNTTVNGANIHVVVTSSLIYIAHQTACYRSSDMVTWTQITGLSGNINDIATDGTDVFIATVNHLYQVTPGSAAATSRVNKNFLGVWFVGNQLLAAEGNDLHTVTSTWGSNSVVKHFQTGFTWTTAFAVGSKIYAGGYSGSRSELFGFTVNSSGTLVVGAEAVQLGQNELLQSAVAHVGFVVLCTNKGVRLATVGQDGSITYGPLIDEPGSVREAFAEGQYVWFTWSSIETGKAGVGRLDLSNTPRPLQPAYATDVYTELTATTTSVARFNDRTVFAVGNNGVYASSTSDFVQTGYVESGEIFFGTVEAKSVTDVFVAHDQLAANESVAIEVFDQDGDQIGEATSQLVGSISSELQLDGEQFSWASIKLTLTGDGTTSPTFHYWRMRAFPVVPPVEQFIVPLLIHEAVVVNTSAGQVYSQNVDETMQFIIDSWSTKKPVTYTEKGTAKRVRIEAYEFAPSEWADNSFGFEGTITVRLVTI